MKKPVLLMLFVAFVALVSAQTSDKKWGLGIGIGAYGTIDDGEIGAMPELYLSRFLSPRFDLMLQGDLGIWKTGLTSDMDIANAFINLGFKLSNETKKFRTYLYAGPGYLADNHDSGLNFDAGLGAKYYFSPATAFYGKAGYINGIEVDGEDYKDDCPTVAGLASLKGCPDADGDGVTDSKDKCPDTPKGWKVNMDGCPIDTDGDGTPDSRDDCPTVAGPKENKGCPIEELNERIITPDQIELQNIQVASIHFVSGKSYLTEYSQGILDKLVSLLNENKNYNVNIFGHTDSKGSDESNLQLSEERIATTTKYLESKGVSANRIIKQNAFGEAKPVASNATAEGRLLNRRVEFEIFKMK